MHVNRAQGRTVFNCAVWMKWIFHASLQAANFVKKWMLLRLSVTQRGQTNDVWHIHSHSTQVYAREECLLFHTQFYSTVCLSPWSCPYVWNQSCSCRWWWHNLQPPIHEWFRENMSPAIPCTLCLLLSYLPFSSHRKGVHATRSTQLRKKSFSFKEYPWDERGLGSCMRRTIWFSAQINIKWKVSKYFSNCTPKSINSIPQTAQGLENKMVLLQTAR